MRKLKGWLIPGNERGNANGIFPIARFPENQSARIDVPGGSPETGLKKPGDEVKPLKANASAPDSKGSPVEKPGRMRGSLLKTPKDQGHW